MTGFQWPWAPTSPRTPGILGINDAADPNFLGLPGDSPGSLGLNDHADPEYCLMAVDTSGPGPDPLPSLITLDQLGQVVSPTAAAKALDQVNRAMALGEINTPARRAAFLAQVAEESAGMTTLDEGGSDDYFDERYGPETASGKIVGNKIEGDGARFKGRGLVQLTGRENYTRAWLALGLPVKHDPKNDKLFRHADPIDPSLAADPETSARIAAWYWKDLRKVNPTADLLETSHDEPAAFKKVTRKINGGINGLDQRTEYYKRAKKALGITWGTLHWEPKPPHKPKAKHAKPSKGPKKPTTTSNTPLT